MIHSMWFHDPTWMSLDITLSEWFCIWSSTILNCRKCFFSARQIINHGHITVNKKRVNIASYVVKSTDSIEVREKSKKLTVIDGSMQSKEREVPEYIQLDDKNKTAKLVRIPKFSEVPFPVIMEPSLVIEYYSR